MVLVNCNGFLYGLMHAIEGIFMLNRLACIALIPRYSGDDLRFLGGG